MNNLYAGDYKRYMLVPAAFFIVFAFMILIAPGVQPGIDLKGGTSIILRSDKPLDKDALQAALRQKFSLTELQISSVSSPSGYGLNIQYAEETNIASAQKFLDQAKQALKSNPGDASSLAAQSIAAASKFTDSPSVAGKSPEQAVETATAALSKAQEAFNLSIQDTIRTTFGLGDELRIQKREIGATLGAAFYSQGIMASIFAFVLVVIVVFVFFREFVPSAAIIAAMLFDIAAALAMMAVLSIPLSLSTIPALLMLIGFSVDTDMLLTTRLLMRKDGTVQERAYNSLITGLTMTGTQLAALIAMMGLSYFWQISVVFEISIVLFFGLAADIISTWLMNAPVLLWYIENKEAKGGL